MIQSPATAPPSYALESPAYTPLSCTTATSKPTSPAVPKNSTPASHARIPSHSSDHLHFNNYLQLGLLPPAAAMTSKKLAKNKPNDKSKTRNVVVAEARTPGDHAGVTNPTDRLHFDNYMRCGLMPPAAAMQGRKKAPGKA
ncbi:hypothetical protein HKX48_001554 [Thoreauomyces humboldtii]|nr:hypothetical protein HKX48_001554 [Thoreauomyces humboldtii]